MRSLNKAEVVIVIGGLNGNDPAFWGWMDEFSATSEEQAQKNAAAYWLPILYPAPAA